jgi:hypothetical protein
MSVKALIAPAIALIDHEAAIIFSTRLLYNVYQTDWGIFIYPKAPSGGIDRHQLERRSFRGQLCPNGSSLLRNGIHGIFLLLL